MHANQNDSSKSCDVMDVHNLTFPHLYSPNNTLAPYIIAKAARAIETHMQARIFKLSDVGMYG
jgi:hypothetical protein